MRHGESTARQATGLVALLLCAASVVGLAVAGATGVIAGDWITPAITLTFGVGWIVEGLRTGTRDARYWLGCGFVLGLGAGGLVYS